MTKLLASALLLGIVAVNAHPELSKRNLLNPLPQKATGAELNYQPYLDFDTDGCLQTAAINAQGTTNPGLKLLIKSEKPQARCNDRARLDNSNTYSRRRCNNGVCATMYEYYYEKDQSFPGNNGIGITPIVAGGHTNDWENVIVFDRDGKVIRVAPSCHGDYDHKQDKDFKLKDGTHPYIVYHKDGASTHCHRIASDSDIKNPENPTGAFFRAPLVGWDGFPSKEIRSKMNADTWGGPKPKTAESEFAASLEAAGCKDFGMDPNKDA